MAIQIQNIDSSANQQHIIIFQEFEITLTLRYSTMVEFWYMDVEYKDFSIFGLQLALGVLHMESSNMPFDFIVRDKKGFGIDPVNIDDFENGRCVLIMLESEDMEKVRNGAKVPI